MYISPQVEEKIWRKHRVSAFEVEEATADPRRRTRRTKSKGPSRVYEAVGSPKPGPTWGRAELITAYDAEPKHRRWYNEGRR
jgi:hypothetical protein